jgi:isopentenyl-diphosphate delta-isomerase
MERNNPTGRKEDPTAEERKKDHIALAFEAQVKSGDDRFYYEPLLRAHPGADISLDIQFLGKHMKAPVWVSSMTGGTQWARTINHNLASVCGKFGLGMGLGSCRILLYDDEYLDDFAVRKQIGDQPLYANLGIAQLETLINEGRKDMISELVKKLEADGLIIHVNPMQEWLQPEGDRFHRSPLDTIKNCLDLDLSIIVKEVGQGMGPESIRSLLELPIDALDFGALGGTNFALLEMMRHDQAVFEDYKDLATIGHTALEMVDFVNHALEDLGGRVKCRQVIISGGVRNFLDGYYLMEKVSLPAIYGQASGFLKHARHSSEELDAYVQRQIEGLKLAKSYLSIRR